MLRDVFFPRQELTRRAVLKTRTEKVEELRTTSWWLPQFQPEAPEQQVQAVRGREKAASCRLGGTMIGPTGI